MTIFSSDAHSFSIDQSLLVKQEIRIFFTALMFLTRLPVPRFTDHAPEYLEKSARYFPLVGWIVGGICAAVLLVLMQALSPELSILGAMIVSVLTTGAFHEDGFADVCDGFGGGWTREKILDIMKDSRLGTYGTIGLIFILTTKFFLLRDLLLVLRLEHNLNFTIAVMASLLAAHAASRFMSVVSIQLFPYVTPDATSKSKPSAAKKLAPAAFLVALVFTAMPFFLLPLWSLLLFPILLLATFLLNRYFKKWIGGHTGDCLGMVQQSTEVLCYLFMLLLWKFT